MDATSDAVVLTCGDAHWPGTSSVAAVPSPPAREDLSEVLADLEGRRLVVCGTDADLAAVLLRLLRTDSLATVTVGYAPTSACSAAARLWGLPVAPAAAARVALHGEPRRMPLVRDDAGGLLVGLGVVAPVRGVAYCDNDLVLRGRAARLEVQPDPQQGLIVRVLRRGLFGVPGVPGGRRASGAAGLCTHRGVA